MVCEHEYVNIDPPPPPIIEFAMPLAKSLLLIVMQSAANPNYVRHNIYTRLVRFFSH